MNIYNYELSFQEQLKECKHNLDKLSQNCLISLSTAQYFIQNSVWWDHPKSGRVRAPRHSKNIEQGSRGWELHFGANRFYISLAINRCVLILNELISDFSKGNEPTYDELVQTLSHQIVCSVGNYNGDLYSKPYKLINNNMIFGTTSVDINDFTGTLIKSTKVIRLYNYKMINKLSLNLDDLIKHQRSTFQALSWKFFGSEGKSVVHKHETWSSQDYFTLLGELKQNLDESEQCFSDIERFYEKYKEYIPQR